jgi:hypothetical protein
MWTFVILHAIEQRLLGGQHRVDGVDPPRHRAEAVRRTTSRRWRRTSTPSSRRSYGDNIASMAWGARSLISTQPGARVPQDEILVREVASFKNAPTPRPVAICDVAALAMRVAHDPTHPTALIVEVYASTVAVLVRLTDGPSLPRDELPEVLAGQRAQIPPQLDF